VIKPHELDSEFRVSMSAKGSLIDKLERRRIKTGKKIKMAICITMYNENEQEFIDSITGIFDDY
jgi:hypothetical protein